jgi:hypothetical protein
VSIVWRQRGFSRFGGQNSSQLDRVLHSNLRTGVLVITEPLPMLREQAQILSDDPREDEERIGCSEAKPLPSKDTWERDF